MIHSLLIDFPWTPILTFRKMDFRANYWYKVGSDIVQTWTTWYFVTTLVQIWYKLRSVGILVQSWFTSGTNFDQLLFWYNVGSNLVQTSVSCYSGTMLVQIWYKIRLVGIPVQGWFGSGTNLDQLVTSKNNHELFRPIVVSTMSYFDH